MEREQTPLVLVFSTSYLPALGGAEIAIAEITKRSASLRFLIITARGVHNAPRFERESNVTIRRLGFGTRFDKWLLPVLGFSVGWKAIRRERRVVLWGMMISQGSIAAYFLKRVFPRVPLVVTLQEGDSEEYIEHGRAGLIYFFWKSILRAADGVTAISAYLARKAHKAGFRYEPCIIPNGVDEHYVSESFEKAPADLFKEECGIAPEKRIVISVSRLARKNGIVDLVRALAQLKQKRNDVVLLLVGDGEERGRIEELVKKLNLTRDVIFAGSVRHEKLLRYYRMSDVFARPSYSEGLGNAFLEAMGAGVPVVATPVGGIKDFIEDGTTGICVAPGDPKSIADGIVKILDDSQLASELSRNARELVIQKYLWVDIAKHMEEFLASFVV
jgi:glycosyltransferase involved in cell wall biosynthesis